MSSDQVAQRVIRDACTAEVRALPSFHFTPAEVAERAAERAKRDVLVAAARARQRARLVGHKIVTNFWRKPGPTNQFDWSAYYDNDEPDDYGHMRIGYGRTEAEALIDLFEEHPR